MQNGGGCGSCSTCGQEGGNCPCSGGNDFIGGGCSSCSTCGLEGGSCPCSGGNDFIGGCGSCSTYGQEGGVCPCSGNSQDGGASLKFLFFNVNDATNGVTDELNTQHKGIMEHFEFVDVKGKTMKDTKVTDFEQLKKQIKVAGVKAYIDENLVYRKLNKRAYTGTEKQKRVQLIELKTEAIKMAVKKTTQDISRKAGEIVGDINEAAKAFKNGLLEQGDNFAVTAAIEIIKSLSDEPRSGNIKSAKEKFIEKLNLAGYTITTKAVTGGFTESFGGDNEFINSIFGYQFGGDVIDSESQDGGATSIPITNALKTNTDELNKIIEEINKNKPTDVLINVDSVLIYETRVTGPAKIFGICTNKVCTFL